MKIAVLLAAILLAACAGAREGQPVAHHLVPMETVRPAVLPEARYATRYNFTRAQLYPSPQLWLNRDAARALSRAQADLAKRGLGLKVYDAYRPFSVQQRMWNLVRDERYVSNPATTRGRHTRGTAVDVTLVDASGRELDMPTDFDDFTEKAHADCADVTVEQRQNREILARAMTRHGFVAYPFEWWHFDLKTWEKFPVLDITAGQLAAGQKSTVPVP